MSSYFVCPTCSLEASAPLDQEEMICPRCSRKDGAERVRVRMTRRRLSWGLGKGVSVSCFDDARAELVRECVPVPSIRHYFGAFIDAWQFAEFPMTDGSSFIPKSCGNPDGDVIAICRAWRAYLEAGRARAEWGGAVCPAA